MMIVINLLKFLLKAKVKNFEIILSSQWLKKKVKRKLKKRK